MQQDRPDDYILATGEAHSVQEWLDTAFEMANLRADRYVTIESALFRPSSNTVLVGDASKARRAFGFGPKVRFRELIRLMLETDLREEERDVSLGDRGGKQ